MPGGECHPVVRTVAREGTFSVFAWDSFLAIPSHQRIVMNAFSDQPKRIGSLYFGKTNLQSENMKDVLRQASLVIWPETV